MTDAEQRAATEKLIADLRGQASIHFSHQYQLLLETFIGRYRYECRVADALREMAGGSSFRDMCQQLGFPGVET